MWEGGLEASLALRDTPLMARQALSTNGRTALSCPKRAVPELDKHIEEAAKRSR
jgi:hypothetical protein